MEKKTQIIYGSICGVLVLALLYYFIFGRFVRNMENLPYFWNPNLKERLFDYISHPPREALMLLGPRGTGKSQALSLFSLELQNQDFFVLNFDFSNAQNISDIIGFGILDAYASIKLNSKEDPRISQFIIELTDNIKKISTSTYAVTKIYDILENYSYIKPLLIVQGSNQITKILPHVSESTFARLSRRNIYNDSIPIIFESTDSSILLSDKSKLFKILNVKSIKDSRRNLIGGRYFSPSEYRTIRKMSGTNGAIVDSVFQIVKSGMKIESAYKTVTAQLKRTLAQYKEECSSAPIKKMCRTGKVVANSQNVEKIKNLIANGFIYIKPNFNLAFGNKLVSHELC